MKTILYISDVNASESIFHSQVLPHINELRKYYDVNLICLSRGEQQHHYDYSYASLSGDYSKIVAYINFLKNRRTLEEYLKHKSIDLIYSRGFRGGLVGVFIKKHIYKDKIKLLNDVRGDVIEEHKVLDSFFKSLLMQFIFNISIKYIFKNSNGLFFVSSYLRDKYIIKYNFRKRTEICPTFVPDNKFEFSPKIREQYRMQLGYAQDDIVLLYSGNFAKWQNVDVILEAFENSSRSNYKLLVLTNDKKIENLIMLNKNRDNIKILFVNYESIENYYFAADYGLLIRDDIDTNRCSAPTKFSEYINSGLILISTDIPADYIDYLKNNSLFYKLIKEKENLGTLINNLEAVKRNNIKVNTLSQLVNLQKQFLQQNLL
jgi:glycosyltransferase involved in cell wall biosynthesis